MGQREDVTASLLASHGVDEVARRKVATDVRKVVEDGADRFGAATVAQIEPMINALRNGHEIPKHDRATIDSALSDVATAASAVVLASDLRAPFTINDALNVSPAERQITEALAERHDPAADINAARKLAERDEDGYYPTKGADTIAELTAANGSAKAWVDRERLAEVARLLDQFTDLYYAHRETLPPLAAKRLSDARYLVRSLLGGE